MIAVENVDSLESWIGIAVSLVGLASGLVAVVAGWRGLGRRRRLLVDARELDAVARSIGGEPDREVVAHTRDIAFWQWVALSATRRSLLQEVGPVLALVEGLAFIAFGFTRAPGLVGLLLVYVGILLVSLPPTLLEAGRYKSDRAARGYLRAQGTESAREAARAAELNRTAFRPTWWITLGFFVVMMVTAGLAVLIVGELGLALATGAALGGGVLILWRFRHETLAAGKSTAAAASAGATVGDISADAAREHLEELLDAADAGRPAVVIRDKRRVAAVDADRLVQFLTRHHPAGVQAGADGDGWSIVLPGTPVAADGATIDEAVEEMIDVLRDYAEAWIERFRLAPNHEDNWWLVQIGTLASDDIIRDWLLAA